jgi:hypothetical protein
MTAHAKLHKPLDAAELERRRQASDDYDALCRFEGIELSDAVRQEIDRQINGEVTPEQCRAAIVRKLTYG